jgi:hypothetical protein
MNLTTESSTSMTALPESWIESLFERMLLTYGRKFADQWEKADMDKLVAFWVNELAGYTGPEIKRGVDALSTRDWPPTLPEFKKLCRTPVDSLVAYYEAVAGVQARAGGEFGKWSHPAIYWAAMPLAFDLGSQTFSQIKPRWERALAEQLDRGEWAEIPRPMLQLGISGAEKLSRESADQLLRKLKATVVTKTASSPIDHRAWARRILEREARGDKSVTLIQAKFAREAMGAPLDA